MHSPFCSATFACPFALSAVKSFTAPARLRDCNEAGGKVAKEARRTQRLVKLWLLSLTILPMGVHAQKSDWVETTLKSMTLQQKIGQLLIADLVAVYSHKQSPVYQYALKAIREYHVGGFILAGGTVMDIAVMTNALQEESKIPLVINADLESGLWFSHPWRHVRGRGPELPEYISGGGTQFPSLMGVGATKNPDYALAMGRITAREARAIGIHWTNSPVADVNNNPENPIINTRSFGENPKEVARLAAAYVKGLQQENVVATLKHFPGHGDTEDDTHMGLPVQMFDMKRLDAVELVPFKAGIEAGAKAVMTAHIALPKLDSLQRPATLSRPIMTGLLRNRMGFQGIIVTDGMTMQGVTDHFGPGEAAVLALEAGADAILVPENLEKAYQELLDAAQSGRISLARIEESVRRILSLKVWLGLHKSRAVSIEKISEIVGDPQSIALAEEISSASMTLLRNKMDRLPLRPRSTIHLIVVTDGFSMQAGTELLAILKNNNHHEATVSRLWNESTRQEIESARGLSRASDNVIIGAYLSVGSWKGKLGFAKSVFDFIDEIARSSVPVFLVAFGDPYILGKLPTTDVVLAAYDGSLLGERSAAKALLGRQSISGTLPVTIPGKYRRGEGIQVKAGSREKGE